MTQLSQEFSVQAADAINQLNRLNDAFSRLNKTMSSFNSGAFNSQAIQASNALNQLQNTTASASNQINQNLKSVQSAGKQTAQSLTVSWETMVRVVTTQAIVRALSQLRDAFRSSVGDAISFQNAIARVQTIAPDATFEQLAGAVRKASDSFNVPVVEAAQGLYQALSNQVGDTAQSLEFFAKATQFATATASTSADAVDLLSGVLKSFGISVDQTSVVAGKLFKTIDLGRITASELANSIGRIGPVAASIGIKLEEVTAALATLTVNGLKTSEAITQINGLVQAFQKPSEAMSAALKSIGFQSGEQAIRTLGFVDALIAVKKASDGSSAALNEFIPRIRGLNAATILGDQLKVFNDNLEQTLKITAGFSESKFDIIKATDAFKVTEEINKVKTALTVDLGQAFLKATADTLKFVGGADALTKAVGIATPAIQTLGLGLAGYALVAGTARVATAGFVGALGPLGATITVLAAAASASKGINDMLAAMNVEKVREFEKANAGLIEQLRATEADRLAAEARSSAEILQSRQQLLHSVTPLYLQDLDAARRTNDELINDAKRASTEILSAFQGLAEEKRRQEESARQAVISSAERQLKLGQQTEDSKFTQQTSGLTDPQKLIATEQRARALADSAAKKLAAAANDEAIQAALQEFQRAQALAQQAQGLAGNDRAAQQQAAQAIQAIIEKQVGAETKLQAIQKQRQAALKQERTEQEGVVDALDNAFKKLQDSLQTFGSGGQKSKEDLAKLAQQRQEALQTITQLTLKDVDLSKLGKLGLDKFVNQFRDELTTKPFALKLDVENGVQGILSKVQAAFDSLALKLPFLDEIEKTTGKPLNGATPDAISKGLSEAQQKQLQDAQAESLNRVNTATVEAAKKNIGLVIDEVEARLLAAQERLANVFDSGTLVGSLTGTNDQLAADITALQQAKEQLIAINEAGTSATQQQILQLTNLIGEVNKSTQGFLGDKVVIPIVNQFQIAIDSVGKLQSANANALVAGSALIRENMEASARAALVLEGAGAGGGAEGRFYGGPIHPRYLAAGGRGLDVVPAMLAPHEVVTNARSARKFSTQLEAINAGVPPVFRNEGGSVVNNTTVGDINVIGASSPDVTARKVMNEIRREQRRGSARLK